MIIHGREVKFLRTVGATCKIADLCPGQELSNIAKLFDGSSVSKYENWSKIITYLSEGYEMAQKFDDLNYVPNPITLEEIMSVTQAEFDQLVSEASAAYMGEVPTVEVEEPKKKEETNETSD